MTKAISIAIILSIMTIVLVGCATAVNKPLVSYERDSAVVPKMSVVDKQGLYALFPGNGVTPLDAAYLQTGDTFGFKNQEGKIIGVYTKAGETKTVNLDGVLTTDYVWKYEGDKQP